MMTISGFTVCVNYSDYFERCIDRWKRALNWLMVVTTPEDTETINLCHRADANLYQTRAFYENRAHFNKGRALARAYAFAEPAEWVVFFDADIQPPPDVRQRIEMAEPKAGNVYGAPRHEPDGRRIADAEPCGWFLLFHAGDANARQRPIVDDFWSHAGNYDSTFVQRWPAARRMWLPIPLTHHGQVRQNWCGRGQDQAMRELIEARRGRSWRQAERVSSHP